MSKGHELINKFDALLAAENDETKRHALREQANEEIAQMLKAEEFKTIEEARTIIHESFGVKVYK